MASIIPSRRWMTWALGLALLLRIAFPAANYLGLTDIHHTDSYSYSYAKDAYHVVDDGIWDFWRRPPGYPLFLIVAGTLRAGGQINLNLVLLLLQGLLGLATCGLVFWGARRLIGASAAPWALLWISPRFDEYRLRQPDDLGVSVYDAPDRVDAVRPGGADAESNRRRCIPIGGGVLCAPGRPGVGLPVAADAVARGCGIARRPPCSSRLCGCCCFRGLSDRK